MRGDGEGRYSAHPLRKEREMDGAPIYFSKRNLIVCAGLYLMLLEMARQGEKGGGDSLFYPGGIRRN